MPFVAFQSKGTHLLPRCVLRDDNHETDLATPDVFTPIVAVPVRDEAERLPKLLTALGCQSWITSTGTALPVVLVLNNCRDGSASILSSMMGDLPQLRLTLVEADFPPDQAHVGSARRVAMETARIEGGPQAVLMSTDADAVPASDWIEANLRAIRGGADLVGGLIVGDLAEETMLGANFLRRAAKQKRYATLQDQLTAIINPLSYDPWPRHSDHTGASLAVRAAAYAMLGGIPAIPCREDVAFVAKARRAGLRLRHAPDVRVQVSARLNGRAKGGMADCIKGWVTAEERGLPHLVEDPAFALRRLMQRSNCASLFRPKLDDGDLSNGNTALGVKAPQIDVDNAIADLERMIVLNGCE